MTRVVLFTAPSCTPCKEFKKDLTDNEDWAKSANLELEIVDMSNISDEMLELATQLGIRKAPTAVIEDGVSVSYCSTFKELRELLPTA